MPEIRLVNEQGDAIVYVGHFASLPKALEKLDGKAAPDPDKLPVSEPGQKLATAIRDAAAAGPLTVQVL